MRTPVHRGRVPEVRRRPLPFRTSVVAVVVVAALAGRGADAGPAGERPMFTSVSASPASPGDSPAVPSATPDPGSQATAAPTAVPGQTPASSAASAAAA